jgi:hypothetical protein
MLRITLNNLVKEVRRIKRRVHAGAVEIDRPTE